MFGPDTHLVFDALQMAGVAAIVAGGAVYLIMRARKGTKHKTPGMETPSQSGPSSTGTDLEGRVRVLERIAVDSSADLSDEIEALRAPLGSQNKMLEGQD